MLLPAHLATAFAPAQFFHVYQPAMPYMYYPCVSPLFAAACSSVTTAGTHCDRTARRVSDAVWRRRQHTHACMYCAGGAGKRNRLIQLQQMDATEEQQQPQEAAPAELQQVRAVLGLVGCS